MAEIKTGKKLLKHPKPREVYVKGEEQGLIIIDGQEYIEYKNSMKEIDGIKHIDKINYIPFDRKEWIQKVKFIAQRLSQEVDNETLLIELLKGKGINELNKVFKILSKKEKKEIKVQDGCVGIKIGSGKGKTGGAYLQLID